MKEADLILTMTRHHRTRVEELGGEGRTFVLGEYVGRAGGAAEVTDPFGSGLEIYRQTYEELEQLVQAAADRLANEYRDASQRDQ